MHMGTLCLSWQQEDPIKSLGYKFSATLVALLSTLVTVVSEKVTRKAEFQTSVASRLTSFSLSQDYEIERVKGALSVLHK